MIQCRHVTASRAEKDSGASGSAAGSASRIKTFNAYSALVFDRICSNSPLRQITQFPLSTGLKMGWFWADPQPKRTPAAPNPSASSDASPVSRQFESAVIEKTANLLIVAWLSDAFLVLRQSLSCRSL